MGTKKIKVTQEVLVEYKDEKALKEAIAFLKSNPQTWKVSDPKSGYELKYLPKTHQVEG